MESLEIGYIPHATEASTPLTSGTRDAPSPSHPAVEPSRPSTSPVAQGSKEGKTRIGKALQANQPALGDKLCECPEATTVPITDDTKSNEDVALGEIVCERPVTLIGQTDAKHKENLQLSKAPVKAVKVKKRQREDDLASQSLLLIEPPRQSIRNRINMEYPKPKEPIKIDTPHRMKKIKAKVKAIRKEDKTIRKEGKKSKTSKRDSRRKGRKAGDAAGAREPHISAQDNLTMPTVGSHAFGSMEAMSALTAETKSSTLGGMSLEARLQAQKQKIKVTKVKKAVEAPDMDIPLLEVNSEYAQKEGRRGIRSSVFAHVMRLVADLPPIQPKSPKVQRRVPAHRPQVWAQSRQELCEALPYYRAFQSGLYLSQGVAFGYLLDGFPAPRDVCAHNGRVIISHGGGQCVRPTLDDGRILPPVLAGDQLTTDFRVSALVRAWQRRVPLVLIAGSGYELLPFKLNCSYAVLGWYWVSLVWTESEPAAQGIKPPIGRKWFKRVKVRFDWVESQGQPWWELSAGPAPTELHQPDEVMLSPQAKRISVSALTNGFDRDNAPSSLAPARHSRCSSVDSERSMRSSASEQDFIDGQLAFGTRKLDRRPRHREKRGAKLEPSSRGIYTPPDTPREASDCPVIIGSGTTGSSSPMMPRLPGQYCLASFEKVVDDECHRDPLYASFQNATMQQDCGYCRKASPRIYSEGWICLETSCTAYWMLDTTIGLVPIPPGMKLSYDARFLGPAPTPAGTRPPYHVVPPKPKAGIPDETGPGDSAGSRGLWRGWVCENCGRANCRFRWEVWQCLGCHKLLAPIDPYSAVIPARTLLAHRMTLLGSPKIDPQSGIAVSVRRIVEPPATVMVYTLPNQIGTIYHVVNDCTEFADGIFDRYQREAASTRVPLFQRRPLNAHQIRGQLLAQHFAVNSGASYKYNVDSLSLSFDDSPSCVMQALDAITVRTEKVVGVKVEFNEVLSVLYREGQKMSWHDDGEPGLGPIVAGLSLGSDAIISWRKKSVHTASNATFNKGLPDPRKEPTPAIALSLTTSHGDIVMMQGRDIQKKYVHRVIPSGFRVAATARVIGK